MTARRRTASPRSDRVTPLAVVLLAYGSGLFLHLRNAGDAAGGSAVLHWLRDSTLALPVAFVVVLAATALARRLGRGAPRLSWVLLVAGGQAVASVPAHLAHLLMFDGGGAVAAGHGEHGAAAHGAAAAVDASAIGGHVLGALPSAAGVLALAFVGVGALVLLLGTPEKPRPLPSPAGLRGGLRIALPLAVATSLVAGLPGTSREPVADAAPAACTTASAKRHYDVQAIGLEIPYNRWGDVDQDGMLYVLKGDRAAVENWSRPLAADPAADPAGNRRLRPRPLVLRANAGECLSVTFTNDLPATPSPGSGLPEDPRASMHAHGVAYDAQTGDGGEVGFNDDTTVGIGESITMLWTAPSKEGMFLIEDRGMPAGAEADGGAKAHGLYGALVVEPAGSTWRDPVSGAPLYTGTGKQSGELYLAADIIPPTGNSFRESVQIAQDEVPGIGFGFNYGAEPQRHREGANRCGDCLGEETSLSSWVYGDPALVKLASGPGPWRPAPGGDKEDCGLPESCFTSNVVHSYVGDPTKIRFGLAGVKETHVFHMHAHQWLAEPHDSGTAGSNPTRPGETGTPQSTTIDSQTFGPGEAFTADLLYGSGSKGGTVGDSIFHCHLYPHFADGFWALSRTHDVREDGTGRTPDGVGVRSLLPLPGRTPLALPTADNPGYPRFIPGEFGWRPPQPPGSVTEGGPTGPEAVRIAAGRPLDPAKVAVEDAVRRRHYGAAPLRRGAPLTDPCPTGARQVTYAVSAIQRDVVYNEAGEHDAQARMLVLDSDVDAVLAGTKPAEPFFFRANAGDCVNFSLTNRLPNWVGGDAFLKLTQTNLVAQHIHLVKFDVLGSDGSTNGWNYNQAAFSKEQADFNETLRLGASCTQQDCRLEDPASWNPATAGAPMGQTLHERWYADYELRTVFTHDHHFAAVQQNRGLFGALVVEPRGFDARDPRTGRYLPPINDPAHGPVCGTACAGVRRRSRRRHDRAGRQGRLPGLRPGHRRLRVADQEGRRPAQRRRLGSPAGRTGALPGRRPGNDGDQLPQRAAATACHVQRHQGRPGLRLQQHDLG